MSVTLNDFCNPKVIDEAQPERAICAKPYNRFVSKELTDGPELNIQDVHNALTYCVKELLIMKECERKLREVNDIKSVKRTAGECRACIKMLNVAKNVT